MKEPGIPETSSEAITLSRGRAGRIARALEALDALPGYDKGRLPFPQLDRFDCDLERLACRIEDLLERRR